MSEPLKNDTVLDEEDSQKDKYLTFVVDGETYGIEIRHVTEIIGLQKITSVPDMPDFVRGIINLRGKIIPVMDMRTRFHKQHAEYHERTCIIVVDFRDLSIGLIVDSVAEVVNIPADAVAPPPELSRRGNRFIMGIGQVAGEVKLLLDIEKLLNDEEAEQLMNNG
jgi:purine-binding chemotaxis protein CheW